MEQGLEVSALRLRIFTTDTTRAQDIGLSGEQITKASEEDWVKWNQFVLCHPKGSVHQTAAFINLQERISGRGPVLGFVLESAGEWLGVCQATLFQTGIPGLQWWYSARGPVIAEENTELVREFIQQISHVLMRTRAAFWRLDPYFKTLIPVEHKPATQQYQPTDTLVLDLTQSEEEILQQMKRKGRYNSNLAQKKGVTVRAILGRETTQTERDIFLQLQKETTTRDGFASHTDQYYHDFITVLGRHTTLFLAYIDKTPVAAAVLTMCGDKAIYYFGASTSNPEYRSYMAPYALQWAMIQYARSAGCTTYDFLGIAPEGIENHSYSGITQFKQKFGGVRQTFAPAAEVPLSRWKYMVYKAIKALTR